MTVADRVSVEEFEDGVVVSLERNGFRGPARTVLLFGLALPWLIVGPAFVLWMGGTVPPWVVVVAAVLSGVLSFGLSLVAFVLATRTHHIEIGEETIRFWTDAPLGSVSREWPREAIVGFEVTMTGTRAWLFIVAVAGGRLALPVTRSAEDLYLFAAELDALMGRVPAVAAE
jgi:hypothetical protein